jgi:hypothetical protein
MQIGGGTGTTPVDQSPSLSEHLVFLFSFMTRVSSLIYAAAIVIGVGWAPIGGNAADSSVRSNHIWQQIMAETEVLGLPTRFLKVIPPDFVKFEFDDLHAFAAEYHLGEHRMVLNRVLSFNAAGGILRPLTRLTQGEMETLYHELFHAYMDYLSTMRAENPTDPLLAFARRQQRCRYSLVLINPVVQRKGDTEERFLSESESWEALNEAWAVFIGWAVWNQLGIEQMGRSIQESGKSREAWLRRLEEADREGKLRGYYEPEDPAERAITRKRFLAPNSRLSPEELDHLMREALGFSPDLIQRAVAILARGQSRLSSPSSCN